MSERNGGINRPGPIPGIALLHVARHYLQSFAISFLFFFVVFFINQILLLAEDILSKNAPFAQTMLLLIYSLPSVVAISFPFSALAGSLMASAGLNADREILAFSAAGISTASLYTPFLILGLAAALFSFSANDYFLPRGSKAFRNLYGDLVSRSAAIELTPFSVKKYASTILVTGRKSEEDIEDILIFNQGEGKEKSLISASKARLDIDEAGEWAAIYMTDILEHRVDQAKEKFSLTRADSLEYRLAIKDPIVGFSGTSPAEMPSRELKSHIQRKAKSL
jgi:lipopolysaccharide export system permease protein